MKTERLLALADFLEKLPRKRFDFGNYIDCEGWDGKPLRVKVKGCGTAGCAIGWVPSVPALKKAGAGVQGQEIYNKPTPIFTIGKKVFRDAEEFAQVFFGLTYEEQRSLFVEGIEEGHNVTPKVVAKRIRKLVAGKRRSPTKAAFE